MTLSCVYHGTEPLDIKGFDLESCLFVPENQEENARISRESTAAVPRDLQSFTNRDR